MVVFVVNNEYTKEELEKIVSKDADFCIKECAEVQQALAEIHREQAGIIFVKEKTETVRLQVHTFGNFEVFYRGIPVLFNRNKSKELLAYLVDRRGASVSTAEACAILWEEKEYNFSLQRQYQTVVSDLMKVLKKYNCPHVIYRTRNSISVRVSELDCDLYKLMEGDTKMMMQYRGEYMSNYSWAEVTAGYLAMQFGFAKGED